MSLKSINPATGELLAEYDEHGEAEVGRRLERSARAFRDWRETSFPERSERLARAAVVLRERRREWAELMTREMGKPIAGAEAEVEKCAWACEHFAEKAERFLAPEEIATDASRSGVRYDPLGPVLAVMPWNFPFWQVFRFAAPAVMAGNVALLKHAGNVSGSALAIEEIFREAGFPDGVFTTLLVPSERVAELIGHEAIRAVTLTGSVGAGRAVAAEAGRHLKKTVLELGGSDPFLVLGDADPAKTAARAAEARTLNSGESCIAAKRFLPVAAVAPAFEEELVRRMEGLAVGDPMDPGTQVGPLAREDLLEELHDQVERTVAAGATLRTGGRRIDPLGDGRGFFYAPTVLTGVEPGMAAFDEETFGPVAAVTRARDAEHALELANRSRFGLGASVWTGDAVAGLELAGRIEAGNVFVNAIVKSDPRLPFGGVKESGYGRELSAFGIREFVNVKTVWV
ncbi:MAG TPA: NAD-dependent succinate-semialdehyde dehydrogenase, partial [Thermoanaerobaculia bacterium]|nr:NAD-dependent succinate-semialdehyde dehydrogenase [Thermoanaerobaculia bacterium]